MASTVVALTLDLLATARGPGLSPDSVEYLSAGAGLAEGRGLAMLNGNAWTLFPPGLPAVVAAGDVVGLSPQMSVRLFTAACFAVMPLLDDLRRPRWLRSVGNRAHCRNVQRRMSRFLPLRACAAATCLLALAACGDDTKDSSSNSTVPPTGESTETTVPAPDAEKTEALRYEWNGGCQMMGPNCATYVVYTDGSVGIYRTGENQPAEVTGSIPQDEISAWLDSVKDVDFQALAEEVGPGTCQACVDGVDTIITIGLASGPVVIDSTVVNFDLENPFFANLETLMEDVRAVGELEVQQRN